MENHLLRICDLSVSLRSARGEVHAVRNVNAYLDVGETLSLVGESGCGKSVTAKTIMHLIPSTSVSHQSGDIYYTDKNIRVMDDKEFSSIRGKEISIIFQDSMSALNPTMKIGNQICEGMVHHLHLTKHEAEKQANYLLSQMRFSDPERIYNSYPHTLSGGQRQRVMIAIAIACNPALLIADEPTTALDVTTQSRIMDILRERIHCTNLSMLFITHDLRLAVSISDRISVMYAGMIVETALANQLISNPLHPYTKGLISALPSRNSIPKSILPTITGIPPNRFGLFDGCPFCSRCSYSVDKCKRFVPPMVSLENHTVCCWQYYMNNIT